MTPDAFFRGLRDQALRARQRRVIVLHGDAAWRRRLLADLPARLGVSEGVWLGDAPAGWREYTGGAGGLIGRECDLAGFEFATAADADRFGALSGSLRAGGLLFLLEPTDKTANESRFLARWQRVLNTSPDALRLFQHRPWPPLPSTPITGNPPAMDGWGCLTSDQRAAMEAVLRVATGHRRRPVVLTADRGRGKSAAFGLAAARLLHERAARVCICGPSLAATQSVFAATVARLPQAHKEHGRVQWREGELRFVAPDELARVEIQADLVLVDEAAALPVDLLRRLLNRYARIAFATTVHGYEGSGQAFSLRFSRELDRLAPGWREVALEEPVRWASGDMLEEITSRLLLLDVEPASTPGLGNTPVDAARFEPLDRTRLAEDDASLREVFGLLSAAHYRTRPRDWVQWLDDEAMALWGVRIAGKIMAVAVTVEEGGLQADLAEAILRGQRRAHGHLLPQVMIAHLGLHEAQAQMGWRIVRIAVHPRFQHQGLGTWLLSQLRETAKAAGLDWLGASFGATGALLRFWQNAGYSTVRLGFTREATSGAHAALVLRGLSKAGRGLQKTASYRFAEGFPGWLLDPLRRLDPFVALECMAGLKRSAPSPRVLQEARRFAAGECSFEDAQPWLRALCLSSLGDVWRRRNLSADEAQLMVLKLAEGRRWAEVARETGLAGRAPIIDTLRFGVERLLLAEQEA